MKLGQLSGKKQTGLLGKQQTGNKVNTGFNVQNLFHFLDKTGFNDTKVLQFFSSGNKTMIENNTFPDNQPFIFLFGDLAGAK